MNAPWLFAEAYKYRRLRECFSISKYFHDYDVFYRQKVRLVLPHYRRISLISNKVRYVLPILRGCIRTFHALR